MKAADVLATAVRSMKGSISRALLTVLGLGIGVGACIAIGSLGTAAVRSVRQEMDRFGVDRIWITEKAGNAVRMGEKDVRALRSTGAQTAAMCYSAAKAHAGTRSKTCAVVATEAEYARIENLEMYSGRFLLPQDGENLLRTAVIEDILKEALFGNKDALGEKIRIGEHTYTVVGVIRTVQSAYFALDSSSPRAYVPMQTYRQLTGRAYYDEIVLRSQGTAVGTMASQARAALKNVHGEQDGFSVTSLAEQIDSANRILSIVTTVLIVVGIICMITGGVGVMNVMLTGVRERRREIGIRKALGARDIEIFMQFLCESVLYGAFGAALGIVLGALMTHLGQGIIGVSAHPVGWVVAVSVAFACAVGAVCGVYPAVRAAAVLPVTAMRQN